MFSNTKNSKQQGDVGLGAAIAYYTQMGWTVAIPLNDSQPYDLLVDDGDSIKRVQVKTTGCKNSAKTSYEVALRTCGGNQSFNTAKKFDASKVEWLFVLVVDGSQYNIPTSDFTNTTSLALSAKYQKYKVR